MLESKDEGICRFCLKTFAGRSMSRHLGACKAKKQQDDELAANRKRLNSIYRLRVSGYKLYWLHLDVKSSATLADLDGFLRQIWLECCGHLSAFTIDDTRYYVSHMEDGWLDEMDGESMNIPLNKVLTPKDKFEYEYDFGSTTYLEGQVYDERKGAQKEKIRILARNTALRYACEMCGEEATECDPLEQKFYCDACLKAEVGEDYEMVLPVVNSPRMGECGYDGEMDFDDFRV